MDRSYCILEEKDVSVLSDLLLENGGYTIHFKNHFIGIIEHPDHPGKFYSILRGDKINFKRLHEHFHSPERTSRGPLVTILICNYNTESYLEECILSALNQTYTNTEIVIVDDASTDNSNEIINRFKTKYPKKITTLFLSENGGIGLATNAGLAVSRGSYFSRLDSDDFMLSHKISSDVEILEKHPSKWGVTSDYIRFTDCGEFLKKVEGTGTALYSIQYIKNLGFYHPSSFGDSEYLFRIQKFFPDSLIYSKEVTYMSRQRENMENLTLTTPKAKRRKLALNWMKEIKKIKRSTLLSIFKPYPWRGYYPSETLKK